MLNFLNKRSNTTLFFISGSFVLGITLLAGTPLLAAIGISFTLSLVITLIIAGTRNTHSLRSPTSTQVTSSVDISPPPYENTPPPSYEKTLNASNLNLDSRPSEPPVIVSLPPVSLSGSNQSEDPVKALKAKKQEALTALQEQYDRAKQKSESTPEEYQKLMASYESHIKDLTLSYDKEILQAKKQRDLDSVKKQYDHSMQKRKRTPEECQKLRDDYQKSVKNITSYYDREIRATDPQDLTLSEDAQNLTAKKQAFVSQLEQLKQEEAQLQNAPQAKLTDLNLRKKVLESQISYFEKRIEHLQRQHRSYHSAQQTLLTGSDDLEIGIKELQEKHQKELNAFSGTPQARTDLIERHKEAIKNFENKHAIVSNGAQRQLASHVEAIKTLHRI